MKESSDEETGLKNDRDHETALEQHSASDPDAPLTPAERRMEERIGKWLERGRAREARARAAGLSREAAQESWTWR
ncbi:hypothetical protein [Nocardiopsis xinjiangensis]|uniref:hypothetical protein n=1 Tax=Nocardiopsis xinjiangensis TaxID=124285 RepID=UPI000475FB05|nr:hypothetical protein [Nocardiopsis xinjiangensis]